MANLSFANKAKQILKAAKFNCTKAQVLTLKELLKADKPLSRNELIQKLGHKCPDAVTVHRILGRFCAKNLVHKIHVTGKASKYELAHNCTGEQCHPHFTCTSCGETYCLKNMFLPLIKGLKKGFVLQRQQVSVEGLCSSCS